MPRLLFTMMCAVLVMTEGWGVQGVVIKYCTAYADTDACSTENTVEQLPNCTQNNFCADLDFEQKLLKYVKIYCNCGGDKVCPYQAKDHYSYMEPEPFEITLVTCQPLCDLSPCRADQDVHTNWETVNCRCANQNQYGYNVLWYQGENKCTQTVTQANDWCHR